MPGHMDCDPSLYMCVSVSECVCVVVRFFCLRESESEFLSFFFFSSCFLSAFAVFSAFQGARARSLSGCAACHAHAGRFVVNVQ